MIKLSTPSIGDEECLAVERVLRSGQLVHGEECELFEKELAHYLGCQDVVVVSSGTSALHLALIALGIGSGDAVLVPDFTFPASANVVELVGARPVFVDVDLDTYNITPDTIRQAIASWKGPEKLRAIMPVHEFGCPADMTSIMSIAKEYGLSVVEDAACGLGAIHSGRKVGTFGEAGCFSFHPRKALTTGEGGAIAANDPDLAAKIRIWRNHGMQRIDNKLSFSLAGFNYRLTNFQAALGRAQLPKFDQWVKVRIDLQNLYREKLLKTTLRLPDEVPGHAWQTFMVLLPEKADRAKTIAELRDKGIETNLGAHGLHCLAHYQQKYPTMCQDSQYNNAERLYTHGLALPLCQDMNPSDVLYVASEVQNILAKQGC